MKYSIISLLLLTVLVTSSITFDDAFALADRDHTKPTIIFDKQTFDDNATINLTCLNHDPTDIRHVMWTIPATDQHSRIHVEHDIEYSFPATDYLNNGDKIKCKIAWVDGHTQSSEWVTSSNVQSLLTFDDLGGSLAEIELDTDNQYNPPTIIFDEREYTQDEIITITCVPDSIKPTTNIIWYVYDEDNSRLEFTHSPAVYSFAASDYSLGDYIIKCRTNFGDGHTSSLWWEFTVIEAASSNVGGVIVSDTNEIDMYYHDPTKNLYISWDFGDNPYRQGCYSKTQIGYQEYTSLSPLVSGDKDGLNFEGTNTDTLGQGPLSLIDVNQTNGLISCQGSMVFNYEDVYTSSYTDKFELYMTFFEVIAHDFRDEPKYDNIKQNGIIPLNEAQFVTTLKTQLQTSVCGELLTGHDEWRFVELIYDITGTNYIVFESVDDCYSERNTHNTHNIETQTKKKNGGSSPPPPSTFGKNKNFDQIITNGFCFNGNCVDVDRYHTEFPLIIAPVGKTSNITVKVYNPHGLNEIKAIQVVLGMPGAGEPLNNGEVINTFYLYQSEIDEIIIKDKNNLIGESTVSTSIVRCSDEFSSKCLELSFDFMPRDQLVNNVVAINTFNIHRAGTTNYLNDGVEFHGESMNEPLITHVSASKGGPFYPENRGSTELQLVSYREDLWQDEYGYLWTGDNNKSFVIISDIPVPIKEPDLFWSVMTRINSNFDAMIIHEQERAVLVFDASELISTPAEPWSYDLPKSDEEKQADLDIRISLEADRAEKELQAYFDYIYAGKIQD